MILQKTMISAGSPELHLLPVFFCAATKAIRWNQGEFPVEIQIEFSFFCVVFAYYQLLLSCIVRVSVHTCVPYVWCVNQYRQRRQIVQVWLLASLVLEVFRTPKMLCYMAWYYQIAHFLFSWKKWKMQWSLITCIRRCITTQYFSTIFSCFSVLKVVSYSHSYFCTYHISTKHLLWEWMSVKDEKISSYMHHEKRRKGWEEMTVKSQVFFISSWSVLNFLWICIFLLFVSWLNCTQSAGVTIIIF